MMEILTYTSLILIVIVGGSIVVLLRNKLSSGLKYILAFSGSFLLATSVIHIIPEVYATEQKYIGVFVLLGFLIQLFLEFFSQGIEHGHIHVHENAKQSFPFVIMISLCIHSLVEGFPIVREMDHSFHEHTSHTDHADHSLLLGILLHKFPIAMALMSMFLKANLKLTLAFFWLTIFAIMAPLGTLIGQYFSDSLVNVTYLFDYALAIVLGMFLHISTTILFESDDSHKFNFLKLFFIITGGVIAVLTN